MMRGEAKKKRGEDGRLNVFWRKNKTFPVQYGEIEESPDEEDTLKIWEEHQ